MEQTKISITLEDQSSSPKTTTSFDFDLTIEAKCTKIELAKSIGDQSFIYTKDDSFKLDLEFKKPQCFDQNAQVGELKCYEVTQSQIDAFNRFTVYENIIASGDVELIDCSPFLYLDERSKKLEYTRLGS